MVKPPWGRITAIDLNTGEHLWMVPNGNTPKYVREHPALQGLEIPRTGQAGRAGAMTTKTLLSSICPPFAPFFGAMCMQQGINRKTQPRSS